MHDSDAELVGRAREGDREAFEQLVRRHLSGALAVALAILADPAEAQDIAQDAFVTALERLDELSRGDAFKGWLLRIVRNRALDRKRSDARFPKLDVAVVDPGDGAPSPERDTARAQLRERLTRALETLPEREREVLLLHDLEGWKHREIGERLGMLEGTVRHVLFRARRMMRERLGTLEENLT
jgi:RNA polymerase sigma-70 factor, ECF subfamily